MKASVGKLAPDNMAGAAVTLGGGKDGYKRQEDGGKQEDKGTMDCEGVEEGGQITDYEGLDVDAARSRLGVHLLLLLALLGCVALAATGFLIGQVT